MATATYEAGAGAVTVASDGDHDAWLAAGRYGAVDGATRWLSLEESVYLAALGRIAFASMALPAAYACFVARDADFPTRYAVYHHYRSTGWIVQSGLAYGTLFALYSASPDDVHSEYLVYLDPANKPLSWPSMQVLTRLSEDVKKTILLCQLHEPSNAPANALVITTPVVTLALSEVMFRYWPALASVETAPTTYAMRPATTIPKRKRR